ncbi:MAG: TolC family protein [Acidobacteria bacterium]|nr:TolC family protein [Acidobacteriota bacterium]
MLNNRKTLILIFIVFGVLVRWACAQPPTPTPYSSSRYLDPVSGITPDEAVALALEYNGELIALRKEVDTAKSLVKQAGLRPNPTLSVGGAKQLGGADNNQSTEVMLPIEIGGRRAARITVARRELEIREFAVANQERLLAADVRIKFGEALAAVRKLEVIEKTLSATRQGYDLVAARVVDGKSAPLEQNMLLVEVNRLKSIRETSEGKVETAMFELRNMIGMKPEEPLRLRGNFEDLIATLPPLNKQTSDALSQRPDLEGVRATERLATARIEQAQSEGRVDLAVKGGYQRMNSSFPLTGFDDHGLLRPIQDVFHFLTFGFEVTLPVRNRNQGAVEAATFDRQSVQNRIAFGELTIRREVAAATARYNAAARSLSIMKGGVRDQANSNLQVIWQTYELGSRSLIEYLAEERRFLDIESELVEAELETYTANVEVMRAVNSPELKKK